MLLEPLNTDKYRFGRFEKCKYKLLINNEPVYSFVTTIRDEQNCIELMLDKAKNYNSLNYRSYKIIKINNEGERILGKGKLSNL